MKHIKIFLFILLLFPFTASGNTFNTKLKVITVANGKYVSQYNLCKDYNFDQIFDSVLQRGKIFFNAHFVIYQLGMRAILLDDKIVKSNYEISRAKNGEVFFPADIAIEILNTFYDKQFSIKDNFIILQKENEPVTKKEKDVEDTKLDVAKVDDESNDKKEKIHFIVIDAGHGGKDPGALGGGGAKEKDVVLQVAKKLNTFLSKKTNNVQIKLTRNKDVFLELGERTEIANKMLKKDKNGIFISIHANASLSPRISGFETYFLSRNPTNDDARVTAALENNVIMMEDNSKHKYNDVEFVEALMLTSQIQKESGKLAELVQNELVSNLTKHESRGVKKADFFVLRGALMPAILVEIGYMTNKTELTKMKSKDYQEKLVKAIGNGIIDFVNNYDLIVNKH